MIMLRTRSHCRAPALRALRLRLLPSRPYSYSYYHSHACSRSRSLDPELDLELDLAGQTVSYVTDVEGNLAHWTRWVNMSLAVSRNKVTEELDLHEDYQVVYGGDVWDRGVGDLRIINDIVSLKKRHPSRVHIILGNRDINKLRLLSELDEDAVKKDLQTYWTGRVIPGPPQHSTGVYGRLRMILERTMGCPHSFEFRRQELLEMGVISSDDSDECQGQKIVDSYLDALRPGGLLAEYLRLGTLALLLGDCLFVHGGFHQHTLGWIPPPFSNGERAESVQKWVKQLHDFHQSEMADLYSGCKIKRINNNSKWDQLYTKESYLEKPYILSSEIIRGFKRGSTELGFPTANLNLQSLLVTPFAYAEQATPSPLSSAESLAFIENLKTGVYVGCARIYNSESSPSINRIYPCVFSVGWNPTYNNSSKTVEVHLLDVDVSTTLPHKTDAIPADFYGEFLDVYSLVYLREEHKFSSIDELISCIREDVSRTKGYIPALQLFLNDKKIIKGNVIDDVESNVYESEPGLSDKLNFVPYVTQPWSAMGGYSSPLVGTRLLQYGMGGLRGRVVNPTVIYDNFLVNGSPQVPDNDVVNYLTQSGISKVFSGHQPHGDSPVVMTLPEEKDDASPNLQFFTCDTSYAKDVQWTTHFFESSQDCCRVVSDVFLANRSGTAPADIAPPAQVALSDLHDTRGHAVSEVCLSFGESKSGCVISPSTLPSCDVRIHGTLSNEISYDFRVDDGYVGKKFDVVETATAWWVKGFVEVPTSGGPIQRVYVVCKSEDRDVFNALISEEELSTFL